MGDLGTANGHYANGHSANGHSGLPDKNSSLVSLVLASPEEIKDQLYSNSAEWKGALPSVETYIRREEHLANQELTKDGGLTTWLLVYQSGHGKREVLCGCETIYKKALVCKNGKVDDVSGHGIGSVFCPPDKRGKGYAGRMMKELAKRLKDWQAQTGKPALFSVLFSDIGKQFYASHGWHPFPSAHVSLPAVSTIADGLPRVQFLTSHDLHELCTLDEKLIRERVARSKTSSRSAVALLPDITTIRWHHAREEFVGKELFDKVPTVKGAIVGDAGSRVWCYWNRVWTNPQEEQPNTLHILRLASEDDSFSDFAPASPGDVELAKGSAIVKATAALLAAAQSEAAAWGMREVMIWNPTSLTLAAAELVDSKVVVQHREKESIPSLYWYGEGSWEDVDWICNEKYGWC